MIPMRAVSLTLAGLLALAAVALAPGASAYPPVCIERNIEQDPLTAHVGQCGPQSAEADLCPAWGTQEHHTGYDDGRVVVDVEWCLPHSPP